MTPAGAEFVGAGYITFVITQVAASSLIWNGLRNF